MIYQRLSKRQNLAMTWWNRLRFRDRDALICDGAIRSGKTVSMAVGFLLWSMTRFEGQTFAICGKTIESLRRNVILHLPDWLRGVLTVTERRSENKLIVTDAQGRSNGYYLFGGRDESSYSLIQGITLAGVLLDEAALMPRSFVEQALARCSVAGSKFWFNCNPAGPEHWFYKEWVRDGQPKRHNALHLHFTMADNPAISPEVRQRYESMYSGVFYDRYIRGLWRVAQGLVYPFFADDPSKYQLRGDTAGMQGRFFVSIDYGTRNPCSMGLWCVQRDRAIRLKESYYNSREAGRQRTDEEHYRALEELTRGHYIESVVVDPSAASFIETIRRHDRFRVQAARNDVLSGIQVTATLLQAGKLVIHESCRDTIREFSTYCWDDKAQADRVVKENDHAMDDIRYFAYTILAREFRWADWRG